jgi:hypothetical protein
MTGLSFEIVARGDFHYEQVFFLLSDIALAVKVWRFLLFHRETTDMSLFPKIYNLSLRVGAVLTDYAEAIQKRNQSGTDYVFG